MEKEDAIRLIAYSVATAVYLTVYNVVIAADAFMRTTDFRLYGSLIIVFSWIILMMLDLTITIGSFSTAWITVVAIGLGLCIIGFGIYMIVQLYNFDFWYDDRARAMLDNSWKFGLFITPVLGGAATNTFVIWKLKDEDLYWWLAIYAAAYAVCVPACAIFGNNIPTGLMLGFVGFCIANVIVGAMTLKEVFF